jgi:hypothetical protein
MIERQLLEFFIDRLPVFDPTWPEPLIEKWLECYIRLWRQICRMEVEEAIDTLSDSRDRSN